MSHAVAQDAQDAQDAWHAGAVGDYANRGGK